MNIVDFSEFDFYCLSDESKPYIVIKSVMRFFKSKKFTIIYRTGIHQDKRILDLCMSKSHRLIDLIYNHVVMFGGDSSDIKEELPLLLEHVEEVGDGFDDAITDIYEELEKNKAEAQALLSVYMKRLNKTRNNIDQ